MTTKTERDPVTSLLAELNGSCKPHIRAAINGNMPAGWACLDVRALATFRDPPVAVLAEADLVVSHTITDTVGVKIEVAPPCDHLKLADELARQLCAKILAFDAGTERLNVRIALEPGAIMPTRGSAGSSGYDMYAPADVIVRRGQTVVIHSGVRIELPDDTWEAQVRPRSSMSKRGLWVSVGTVDSDYRGAIGATVTNVSGEDQTVKRGERFAQLVFGRVEHLAFEQVEVADLSQTERGDGAFGSTGR